MKTTERLLRIAGLLIIIRDEVEEQEIMPKWLDVANDYLNGLTNKSNIVNEEYNALFQHIDSIIREVDEPCNLINELFKILQKDLKKCGVTHAINEVTNIIDVYPNIKLVKLLDSKIRLV